MEADSPGSAALPVAWPGGRPLIRDRRRPPIAATPPCEARCPSRRRSWCRAVPPAAASPPRCSRRCATARPCRSGPDPARIASSASGSWWWTAAKEVGERIDIIVAGVGTGGTLFGIARALRERNPNIKLVAVEPAESAILSGETDLRDHKIAGIGDGFVPKIVKINELDFIAKVKSDDAVDMAKRLCKRYGLMVGISSGANILGVAQALEKFGQSKVAVTVLPDRAERYFSTDLYLTHEHLSRTCTPNCECVFS